MHLADVDRVDQITLEGFLLLWVLIIARSKFEWKAEIDFT
jgi:hypothetical protein